MLSNSECIKNTVYSRYKNIVGTGGGMLITREFIAGALLV